MQNDIEWHVHQYLHQNIYLVFHRFALHVGKNALLTRCNSDKASAIERWLNGDISSALLWNV